VLVSGALIVLTVLFGLEIASEANGHSIDPTDPMNYNTYALRNDSTTPQYVHLCADEKCATLDGHLDWVPVRPGSADDEQVYWGWSTPSVFAVALTPSGAGRQVAGPVVPRTTSSTGSSVCVVRTESGLPIQSSRVRAATAPMSVSGTCTVVNGGVSLRMNGRSLKPVIE
jgi:hypothetical protein